MVNKELKKHKHESSPTIISANNTETSVSATPYACTSAFTICQGVTSTSSPSHVKQGEEEVGSSRVTGLGRSRRLFQIHAARARGRTRTQTLSHILWQVVCVWVCVCSVAQLCLTLCDPMVCSLRGSSMHGISQARTLEQVVIFFSRGSSVTC